MLVQTQPGMSGKQNPTRNRKAAKEGNNRVEVGKASSPARGLCPVAVQLSEEEMGLLGAERSLYPFILPPYISTTDFHREEKTRGKSIDRGVFGCPFSAAWSTEAGTVYSHHDLDAIYIGTLSIMLFNVARIYSVL